MGKMISGIFGGGSKPPAPAPPPPAPTVNDAAADAAKLTAQQQILAQEQGYASTIKTSGQGSADQNAAVKKTLGS